MEDFAHHMFILANTFIRQDEEGPVHGVVGYAAPGHLIVFHVGGNGMGLLQFLPEGVVKRTSIRLTWSDSFSSAPAAYGAAATTWVGCRSGLM
jgi:hypothetical protein